MPSDCSQDRFVLDLLKHKREGFWIELGCQGPIRSSNTHILETSYGWQGISIDIDQNHINTWAGVRNTDKLLCADALSLDYEKLFLDFKVPDVVDYLSVDLEPPPITFEVLKKIPFYKYKFRVITFEHDDYRNEYAHYNLKNKSREFFKNLGYLQVPEEISNSYHTNINVSEDWYIIKE